MLTEAVLVGQLTAAYPAAERPWALRHCDGVLKLHHTVAHRNLRPQASKFETLENPEGDRGKMERGSQIWVFSLRD